MARAIVTQERRRRSSQTLGVKAAGTAPRIQLAEGEPAMRVPLFFGIVAGRR
jgi:hypothetical protein